MFLELILSELWGPCWLQIPLSQTNLQCISPGQAFPYPRTRPDSFLSLFLFFVLLFSCFLENDWWLLMSMRDCSSVFPPTTVKGEGKNKREMHYMGEAKTPADPCPAVAPPAFAGEAPLIRGAQQVSAGGAFGLGARRFCFLPWDEMLR